MALFRIYKGLAANLPSAKHEGWAYLTTDNAKFYIDINDNTRICINNWPTVLSGFTNDVVSSDTTANWNAQPNLQSEAGKYYIYTDYKTKTVNDETVNIPGIKFGDGNSYVIDLPFFAADDTELTEHVSDNVAHVTALERANWNDKVTAFISPTNSETVVFSKENQILSL